MHRKNIALRSKSLLLECGANFLGCSGHVQKAFRLIEQTKNTYGLDLELLIYTRSEELAHTNLDVGGQYLDIVNINRLFKVLNENGLNFNLALNGSPDFYKHVPLDLKEMNLLEDLCRSGVVAGLRNSVTIADDALLPTIRQEFPELDMIASCISPSYAPNIIDYRRQAAKCSDEGELLISYYNYLYKNYDKVVPVVQLANPIFLKELKLPPSMIATKTITFLNLFCGSINLGRCTRHYAGFNNEIEPNMPIIPEHLMSQKEGLRIDEAISTCTMATDSIKLINRPNDLRAMLKMGINQFKIPARDSHTQDDFRLLCELMMFS